MTNAPKGAVAGSGSGIFWRLLPLLVLVAIAGLIYLQGWHRYLSPQNIAYSLDDLQNFIGNNLLLAVAAYVAIYIGVVALSLPGAAILSLTGGLLFGWQIGMPATVVAATIGATIIFLIVKTSLGEPLAAHAGPWLDKLSAGFQENAFNYLLFLRLVPAFPFLVVNLAPALLGVPLRTFVLGTAIGIIPGSFAFTYLGSGLDSVLAAGRTAYEACVRDKGEDVCSFPFDPSVLVTTEILLAIGALGIVALIPVIIQKLSRS